MIWAHKEEEALRPPGGKWVYDLEAMRLPPGWPIGKTRAPVMKYVLPGDKAPQATEEEPEVPQVPETRRLRSRLSRFFGREK